MPSSSTASLATEVLSERLLRLPLWVGLEAELPRVVAALREAL